MWTDIYLHQILQYLLNTLQIKYYYNIKETTNIETEIRLLLLRLCQCFTYKTLKNTVHINIGILSKYRLQLFSI